MNVSLISMKNIIFLLGNPLVNVQKVQNFRACGALRGSLIILRISESEIQMYRLLAFRKSVQMSMYRLLRGGGRLLSIDRYRYARYPQSSTWIHVALEI